MFIIWNIPFTETIILSIQNEMENPYELQGTEYDVFRILSTFLPNYEISWPVSFVIFRGFLNGLNKNVEGRVLPENSLNLSPQLLESGQE